MAVPISFTRKRNSQKPKIKLNPKQTKGQTMDRLQAVNLLREIFDQILNLSLQTVNLVESKSTDPLSPNYSLRFTGLGDRCIEQIENLVKHHGFKVKVKKEEVIICD